MAWIDIAFWGGLGLSVVLGFWRGLTFELLSLLGWVAAYFAAPFLQPLVAANLPAMPMGQGATLVVAWVLSALLILVLWGLAAKVVRALLHATPLNVLDRMGGAVFGALRAFLLSLLLVVLVGMTPAVNWQAWQSSQWVPWLQLGLSGLKPWVPPAVQQYLSPRESQAPMAI
ncbi:CvpA family protein [Roseateles sp. BYS180W]|uniref:CvpA family protein n=1 Tax=Roseateles rivi TaxID=3299028 RepID=A0ABW7FY70_9BURK